MKKLIAFLLVFLSALTLLACKKDNNEDKITFDKDTVELTCDSTASVVIKTPTEGTFVAESANTNLATATVKDLVVTVTGKQVGETTVTVTLKGTKTTGSFKVVVKDDADPTYDPNAQVTGITISTEGFTDTVTVYNNGYKLKATVTPSNANPTVRWSSSNNNVAKINSEGVIEPLTAGTVTFTATSLVGNVTKEITVNVVNPSDPEQPISLTVTASKSPMVLTDTETEYKLTAVLLPETAIQNVTFESLDTNVATIDANGVITLVDAGEAKFKVTSTKNPNISKTITIDVYETVTLMSDFTLNTNSSKLNDKPFVIVEKTLTIETSIAPTDATYKTFEWSVEPEGVVTLAPSSTTRSVVVTGVQPGDVTITCNSTDGSNLSKTIAISCVELVAPTSMEITPKKDPYSVIENLPVTVFNITYQPANADTSVVYTSSNPEVATVDENGLVTYVSSGNCVITCKSKEYNFEGTCNVVCKTLDESTVPEEVVVYGVEKNKFYYTGLNIPVSASVLPSAASQNVTWSTSDENIAKFENGYLKLVGTGKVYIIVKSNAKDNVLVRFQITVIEDVVYPLQDLHGYEIVILNAESALKDIDPNLPDYNMVDKTYKQRAWREVQEEGNCIISVKAYPDTAPWGKQRIAWIKTNAANNASEADLMTVASNWLPEFVNANAAADVTAYYNKYGKEQMTPGLKESGSFKYKIYAASIGSNEATNNVTLGLYYNVNWVKQLGVDDPAELFNTDKWTYTGFSNWVRQVQAKLGNDGIHYCLGGHPMYYWFGLSEAAGIKVVETKTASVNLTNSKQKDGADLIKALYKEGCMDNVNSWAEKTGPFYEGNTVMSTGFLEFVHNGNRWPTDMWGAGDATKVGYVPFPYPDNMDKADTRVALSGNSLYMYVTGRNYPAGVTLEYVYQAVNEVFLRTVKYQSDDQTFNASQAISNYLKSKIDNAVSVEAMMYYNSTRTFFDPGLNLYDSIAENVLKSACVEVIKGDKDYYEAMGEVYDPFFTRVTQIYG